MIVKFREDQIMRLEKLLKEGRGSFLPEEQDRLLSELRDEIHTLREQVSHDICSISKCKRSPRQIKICHHILVIQRRCFKWINLTVWLHNSWPLYPPFSKIIKPEGKNSWRSRPSQIRPSVHWWLSEAVVSTVQLLTILLFFVFLLPGKDG